MKKIIWSDSHLTSDGDLYREFFIEGWGSANSENPRKLYMAVDWAVDWFTEEEKPKIPVFEGKRLREVKL